MAYCNPPPSKLLSSGNRPSKEVAIKNQRPHRSSCAVAAVYSCTAVPVLFTGSTTHTRNFLLLLRMRRIELGPVYSSVPACAGSSIVVPYLFGSVSISDTRCTHSRAAAVNSSTHPGSLLFATVICTSHFLTVSPYSIHLMRHSSSSFFRVHYLASIS